MDIIVIRGEGDSAGDDIVDPLLSNVSAALSRGRAELDQNSLADEQQLIILFKNIFVGQLVEVEDSVLGSWKGKVLSVGHTIVINDEGHLSAETTLTLSKPRLN